MKYFLDTNIILILYQGRRKEIKQEVSKIIANTDNRFFASAISLNEIIQLHRKRKIQGVDYDKFNTPNKLIKSIVKTMNLVTFLPFDPKHALKASSLTFVPKHNDPNDLAIIAPAMGEKATLISTDGNFPLYEQQGAKIVYNPR